jgi:hypothetical protein
MKRALPLLSIRAPELLPPDDLIEAGDMDRMSAPLDFLGLNDYCPYCVRMGDWDELRLDEARSPGIRASSATCRRRFHAPTWAR